MTAQKGRDLLLKVDADGLGAFQTVAGLRSHALAFNAERVDITHQESAGAWRELLEGAGLKSANIRGSGIFKDAASDALKRCAMRLGLGLHLWAQEHYFLDQQLRAHRLQPSGCDDVGIFLRHREIDFDQTVVFNIAEHRIYRDDSTRMHVNDTDLTVERSGNSCLADGYLQFTNLCLQHFKICCGLIIVLLRDCFIGN